MKIDLYEQNNMLGRKQGMEHESDEYDDAEIWLKLRSLPPTHYTFKIENFSFLSHAKADNFQSCDFEAGRYKWKLSVYPGGNKKKKGDGYISLYLVLSESNKLSFNREVNVNFKLFVYDYIRDKYLTVQDEKVRRFCGIRSEWGFDKLVSLTDFKDESNGYLMDDCCIFGAEILVLESVNKGECLSMVKTPANNTYTWTIHNFSELDSVVTKSEVFVIGGSKWRIDVHPKGDSRAKSKSLSMFLNLEDDDENGRKLYAEFVLRVRNHFEGKHREVEDKREFKSKKGWGSINFMSLSDLNDKSKGFIHNNTLIVELEI